ncbi:Kelch-like protein 40 [Lamellibrachia satsuma]|nr:Kelch-like protein 40 [Lamellibrachia satsuma]
MAPLTDSKQHERLLCGMIELYDNQTLTDVILMAEGKEIACHRSVLAASSPYFRAMFTNNVMETTADRVKLQYIDIDSLQAIVDYMYRGCINIDEGCVQNIFTTASLFEMVPLCELCAIFMTGELCIANCVGLYQFASFHHSERLKTASKNFVVEYFGELAQSSGDMLELSFADLAEVISDDNLNVSAEEVVFDTVIKWIEFDLPNRRPYLSQLFRLIRFVLIPEGYISDVVCCSELIASDTFCMAHLSMVKLFRLTKGGATEQSEERFDDDFDLNTYPRLGMYNSKMMVFAGGSQDRHTRALTCYDPKTRKNYYAIPLHVSFDFKYRIDYHRTVVTDDNKIYLIGGIFYEDHHFETAGPALNEVKMFDPYRNQWIDCAPLLRQRCAHAVAHHNGAIFVTGGKMVYPGGDAMSSVERYDIATDRWQYVSDMPAHLCHHVAQVHRSQILVLGGMINETEASNIFLQYNISNDCWQLLDNRMRVPRAEFGVTILNDELYVIGGCNGGLKISSVEILNLVTEKWRFGPDFPEDRKSMVAVTYEDSVIVCGGIRTLISRMSRMPRVVETRDMWKFNPTLGVWSREAKLVQYANTHACVIVEMNTKRLHESEYISR